MKKLLVSLLICMPLAMAAQTQNDRVAELQAAAAAKAKAAQEAALAAQEAARAAQEAAEAAAAEAKKVAEEAQKAATAAAEEVAKQQAIAKEQAAQAAQQKAAEKAAETTVAPVQPAVTQNKTWAAPQQTTAAPAPKVETTKESKKAETVDNTNEYLAINAVPVVNGEVEWTCELDVPGKNASQLYDTMLQFLTELAQSDNQLERSRVALVNEDEHKIIATMQEWLVFTSSALSLDRTKFSYVLQANCSDGHVQVVLSHISYNYAQQGKPNTYKAESWITDEYSVNKKRTRLYPISGKFRRKTIDRKNELFKNIAIALKL